MDAAVPTRFDAVVVGAGPAGSTVAIQLSRAGWSVALVEKQRFPRRKVCGECIAASNIPLLEALGLGDAFDAMAGAPLRRVALLRGHNWVSADLPRAQGVNHPWGRALGRETLDVLLLEQARAAGATVIQPGAVKSITGSRGAWHCDVRVPGSAALLRLRASVMIDAHGSWEGLCSDRPRGRQLRGAGDLFAFKANFSGSTLATGQISVLALDGGYGGMVIADSDSMTLACCIRRERLNELRAITPGASASDVVESWMKRTNLGVRDALNGAVRDGPWLASGPLTPGVRLNAADGIFRCGNAAGEAHPILGEGMSMALQSGAMLAAHLLGNPGTGAPPDAHTQALLQSAYVAEWHRQFTPRLRLAAVFAHLAMRPRSSAVLMKLTQLWPGLLTQGARWGGKTRTAALDLPPGASSACWSSPPLDAPQAR